MGGILHIGGSDKQPMERWVSLFLDFDTVIPLSVKLNFLDPRQR